MRLSLAIAALLGCALSLVGELKAENAYNNVADSIEVVAPLNDIEYGDFHSRQKRWVALVARVLQAAKGSRAMGKLLKGTKPGKNKASKTTREHYKDGDMKDAVDLHKSLGGNPKPLPGGKVKGFTSKVGDRTFTVRDKSGSGKPTIETFKTNSKKGKDRITDKVRFEGKKDSGSSGKKSGGGGGGWWGKRRRRRSAIDLSELDQS